MALFHYRLSSKSNQLYGCSQVMLQQVHAKVRSYSKVAPPPSPPPNAIKGDEMLRNIFLEVKNKFETAVGFFRKEKITIDPEDPAAVSHYAKVMKQVRQKAGLFSESERVKNDIQQETQDIQDARSCYLLKLKELRVECGINDDLGAEAMMMDALEKIETEIKKGMALLTAEFDKINNKLAKYEDQLDMNIAKAELQKMKKEAVEATETQKKRQVLHAIQVRSYSKVASLKKQRSKQNKPVHHATTIFHHNWSPEAGYNFAMACYHLIQWNWLKASNLTFMESSTWLQKVQSLGTSDKMIKNNPFVATLLGTKDPKNLVGPAALFFFYRNVLVHHRHQGNKATSLIEQDFHQMFPQFLPDLISSVNVSLIKSPRIAFNQLTGFNVDRLLSRSYFK